MNLKPTGSLKTPDQYDKLLADQYGAFYSDPLGYVQFNYIWGEGELEHESGPDQWQTEFLAKLGEILKSREGIDIAGAIRMAVASGHGVGKTAMVSWLIQWFMSTRPKCQIVVTANTQAQLNSKTWRELSKWHRQSLNRHWFQWTATRFYHVQAPELWCAQAQPWSEHNSEAFAGTHEKDVLIIFDEASAIPELIWNVAEGAMTTPGAMWFSFGNPTRNSGPFYECFNNFKHRWMTYQVDSRKAKAANQQQIKEWVEDYGEDSDFIRVRVAGIFPRQSSSQFISKELAEMASKKRVDSRVFNSVRPVIGVDVARFGADSSIIVVRQGDYIHPAIKFNKVDTMQLAGHVVDTYRKYGTYAIICVDGGGVGGGVVDRLRQLGLNVIDVQSAAKPTDIRTYANKRAEYWGKMKDWLMANGAIPDDKDLVEQLSSVEYGFNSKLQILLQSKDDMKKEGKKSPDIADAIAYTFAFDEYNQMAMNHRARTVKKVNWS